VTLYRRNSVRRNVAVAAADPNKAGTRAVSSDWSQPRRTGSFHGALSSDEMRWGPMGWNTRSTCI